VAISLVTLVLAMGGCGGPSAAETHAAALKKEKASAAAAAKKLRADQQAAHDQCVAQLQPFIDALNQVNSRLEVGLNYSDYGDRLGDAQVAYDKIQVDGLADISPKCLDAAAKLEHSYNEFLKVKNVWSACIDDYACDFSKGTANDQAQQGWQKAGQALKNGTSEVEGLAPAVE